MEDLEGRKLPAMDWWKRGEAVEDPSEVPSAVLEKINSCLHQLEGVNGELSIDQIKTQLLAPNVQEYIFHFKSENEDDRGVVSIEWRNSVAGEPIVRASWWN